jgi:hypothetical protein
LGIGLKFLVNNFVIRGLNYGKILITLGGLLLRRKTYKKFCIILNKVLVLNSETSVAHPIINCRESCVNVSCWSSSLFLQVIVYFQRKESAYGLHLSA